MTAVTSEAPRDLPFFFEQKYREPATFMTLPVELRLEIYSYLLVLPEEWNPAKQAAPPALYPEILSACQQTYEEAVPMLYKPNKFTAHPNFLTTIPRLHTTRTPVYASHLGGLIRRFYLPVRLDADPAFDEERATAALNSLDELDVVAWETQYGVAGPEALRPLEAVRGGKKAKVAGDTMGFTNYARWLEQTMMKDVGEPAEPFEEWNAKEMMKEEEEED